MLQCHPETSKSCKKEAKHGCNAVINRSDSAAFAFKSAEAYDCGLIAAVLSRNRVAEAIPEPDRLVLPSPALSVPKP